MKKGHLVPVSIFLLVSALTDLSGQIKPDALELFRAKRYEESINVCLAEIQENSNNTESYVVLCWALLETKRYEEADKWAETGRTISKYDPRLIEIQAEAKFYRGINDQSLKLFQEYINYAPNGSRISSVYYFMGEIYLRQAKYRHADISFSSALQLESLNAFWWVRLGYAREMAQDYLYSLNAYKKALELDGTLQDAVRGRDRVLKQLN